MRLRWYDRILMALAGLILIGLGALVILSAAGVITLPEQIAFDTWLGDGWQWMPLVFLAGALLVIWGFWMLIRPFRRGSEPGKYYTLKDEKDGDVRISVHAIDHLVHKCIDRYQSIASSKVRIGGREDAMDVTLRLTVRSDVRIPELVSHLQEDIKSSLMHSAGVTVDNVRIFVDATKDDKDSHENDVKYIESHGRPEYEQEPIADPINTTSFYTTPVVVTDEARPTGDGTSRTAHEPTVSALKQEVDFGPKDPLPVELSSDAFPFPAKEAGVPLEIYTEDLPQEDAHTHLDDEDDDEMTSNFGDVEDDGEEESEDA